MQINTSTAFLLIITKCSALCIKKFVNLEHKISSILSACLILIETRTEFIDGSIKHFSCSVLDITIEFKRSSLLPLVHHRFNTKELPNFNFRFVVALNTLRREIANASSSSQCRIYTIEIIFQSACLKYQRTNFNLFTISKIFYYFSFQFSVFHVSQISFKIDILSHYG